MSLELLRMISVRHLVSERLRSLLVLFGIALGVAVFVSVRIANVSALDAFRSTLDVVSGPANLIVRPAGAPLPDRVFPEVWRLPGVLGAAPRIEATVPVMAPPGRDVSTGALMILGIDPFTQADLEPIPLTPGSAPNRATDLPANATVLPARGTDRPAGIADSIPAPQAAGSAGAGAAAAGHEPFGAGTQAQEEAAARFFTQPDAILVTEGFARRQGLGPGSVFRVIVNGASHGLTVLGILPPTDLSRAFGGDVGVMDIANAQELLGRVGRIDRIDLHTLPSDEARVERAIRSLLPRGTAVGPPAARLRQAQQMVSAFQLNLTALSLISALVGVFIIYNALLIAVLRRRKEIATLRSLGVTRGGIAAMFLTEAALLGAAGSALGLVLGAFLARYTLRAVSGTISALYLQVQARELVITPGTLLMGAGLGMVSALIAGLAPALEAAATPPAETLRERTAARPARRRARPWLTAGAALLAAAGITSTAPVIRDIKVAGFAGALALLLGFALATPALLLILSPATRRLYRRLFGVEGDLAAHEIRAALDRSAAVVSALGVAVAMLIGLAIMVGSFRRTLEVWIDGTIRADVYIGPAGQAIEGDEAVLPAPVVQAARSLPDVEAIDLLRSRSLEMGGRPVFLSAPDVAVLGRRSPRLFLRGNGEHILTGIAGKREAAVSESFARRFHVGEGDVIQLPTPGGPIPFTVRGVYYDYTSDAGVVMIDRSVYARLWRDPAVNNVALYLRPGVSPDRARAELLRRLGGRYELQISDNRELRRNILAIFDQTFAITYALQGIAILVAMLGIGNALIAILLQRQREIGILRAVGASRAQIVGISLLEASLLATWGWIVGGAAGTLLALHLVYDINRQFFGWTLQFHMALAPFIYSYALVLSAALLAALIPARMAAGVNVADAVRSE